MQLFTQPPRNSMQATVIPDDVPVYRIKEGKFFADDELFEAGSIIAWPEEPNMEMEPLNTLAREAMLAYLDKLDAFGREVATKTGKMYLSHKDAFENSMALAKQDGRRVSLLNGSDEVPIMGGKKRGRRKAQKVELGPVVEDVQEIKRKKEADGRKAVNSGGVI